jgi:Peptidase propeptide and YPEB domain
MLNGLAVSALGFEPDLNRAFSCRSGSRCQDGRMKTAHLLLLAALAASPLLTAASGSDQDRARAALQAGEVLSLRTILERKGGRWIYELKLVQTGRQLIKLEIDASSGEVLRRDERSRR